MDSGHDRPTQASRITIGDLTVRSEGNAIVFEGPGGHDMHLDDEGVRTLLEFLRCCKLDEHNRRRSYRVPISADSGLTARVRLDETTWPVIPIDLSLIGALIEMPEAVAPKLTAGAGLNVTLGFQGRTVSVRGEVKRIDGNRFGIFFPGSMKGGEIDAPPDLVRIVMELQRRWLAHQVHS